MTFPAPEYLELCKKHPLERTFQEGDWIMRQSGFPPDFVMEWTPSVYPEGADGKWPHVHHKADQIVRWIPRLDQLLDLLEAESNGLPETVAFSGSEGFRGAEMGYEVSGPCTSREEAAYRLLLAVRESKKEKV